MDDIVQYIITVIVVIIGTIDIGGIIGCVVSCIKSNIRNKKAIEVTKQQIEEAFKNAILPKNVKLDVSSKIEKPIKNGLEDIKVYLQSAIERIDKGEQLILSILSKFSHIKQLPEDVQKEIEDYVETNTSVEITLDT